MKYTAIFCGGDIKLSGKMVLRKNESHVRSIESQKVFLYKYKPTARNFGKRFGGGKGYEKYRLDKNLESTNPKSNIIFRQLLKIALQVIYGIFLGRFLLSFD